MIFKVALMSSKLMTPLNYLRKIRVRRFMKEKFTPTQYSSPNVDAVPHMSATGLLENLGDTSEQLFVRSFKDFVEKKAEVGEWRAYSTTTGATAAAEVWVKSDGSVLVQSNTGGAKIIVNTDGSVSLNGESFGGLIQIALLTDKLNALVEEIRTHTHVEPGPAPVTEFTDFLQATYENTAVNHGV